MLKRSTSYQPSSAWQLIFTLLPRSLSTNKKPRLTFYADEKLEQFDYDNFQFLKNDSAREGEILLTHIIKSSEKSWSASM